MKSATRILLACLLIVVAGCQPDDSAGPVPPEQPTAAPMTEAPPSTQPQKPAEPDQDLPATTPPPGSYQAGRDYLELTQPVATIDGDRIEVTEVFWYGCSHCFAFEPLVGEWSENLPDDVVFRQSPAMWDREGIMEGHARMYYTARALGILDRVHRKIFEAMNLKKVKFRSLDEIADFFVDNGISREVFNKTFNSFGVTSAVRQAEARQRSYEIQGTPELVVNGRYRVTGRLAGGHEQMLKIADFLVDQERQAANP